MNERERHRRASVVFGGAVALPEAARDAFVTTACAGDADLEKEVRSLLNHHIPESQAATEPSAPEEPKDMTGAVVGHYRIESLLGTGGMGVVWKAHDETMGRAVAIKFLPAHMAKSEVSRRRFLREARAASSLTHPGVATVYDVGEHGNVPFIAMQLVEGRTVQQRLKQQSYAPAEAVRVALLAAHILDYAHSQGVVHRDVKSSNIMVTNDGAIVLLDFGVALRSADTSRLSRTGELVGTVGFIAPEVLLGNDGTAQSDVYGLAVALYQMVTGYTPFGATRNDAALGTPEIHPEPVSRLVRGVPKEVDRVLAKALARDLAQRYKSAKEFSDDLESLLRDGSLSRYPRAASRAPRPRPSRRGLALFRGAIRLRRPKPAPK